MRDEKITIWDYISIAFYRFTEFFVDFIIPGKRLWKALFRPYNKLKLPQLRPWQYCDPRDLMIYANIQVLEKFWEEKPEELVCWKVDEAGNDVGPRVKSSIFPEIDGKYVIDVAHDIDYEFKTGIEELKKEIDAMYSALCLSSPKHVWATDAGKITSFLKERPEVPLRMISDYSGIPEKLDEQFFLSNGMTEEEVDVLHKRFGKSLRRAKLNDKKLCKMALAMEDELDRRYNKAIQMLAEIRQYLWI